MKNIRFLLIILIFISCPSFAQLAIGDIAFIGYNTDSGPGASDNDGFSFIALTDIPASTIIYFTEEGWNDDLDTWVGNTEGHIQWTAPGAGLGCGSVVYITESTPDNFTVTGGGTATLASGAGWSLIGGDQILAYQAASAEPATVPTFLAAINGNDGDAEGLDPVTLWDEAATILASPSKSCLPFGLTNGVNCVALFVAPLTEKDNAKYTGTLTGTSTALRAAINNRTNWSFDDATAYDITPGGYTSPSVTCVAPCTNPTVPTVTFSPGTVCAGSTTTLTISGTLNDATAWKIYSGSCGGTLVGTTAGTTFVVTPGSPSTTYFVRGEGGCVTPGTCGSVTVTTTALDNASFTYSAAAYCVSAADPTPTISGLAGGTFSSGAGLSINASTGKIDVSASTPGTYTVTYTTAGTCPNSSNVSVTINAIDNATFSYSAAAYCANAADPTPTISGLAGGTFSSGAGLSINASTGKIDVSASTPGTYTVTYTTAGACPNSSNVSVTINAVDNASFSYSAAAYCVSASDPTPTISGLAGGTFSSGAGLSINASTGTIDVSASTPGTYTVTYTTSGTCPNSSNVSVTINAIDNASFSYSAAAYCASAADPTPTISGLAGGTFSSGAGLSINASTGKIDVSASTPGTYTVTYTTAGACPNSSNVSVTINAVDNASFSYSAAAYCVSASDPTPTISGLAGGTFSSGAGLSINASTGTIDVSASTPGTYTVTYTTAGTCPNSSNVSVTINAIDNASFSYSAAAYCVNAADPTPTISGLAGGTFSSGAGLSINASTGKIDVSASTPGTYTVTYTTAGACPNSSNVSVTINAVDNASFSYSAAAYCVSASDPTPTISGLAGGTFSSGAGLSINASTGTIDVSASTPGTYTVTYTTSGTCPNSSNVSVTINAIDNASFSYSAAAYCVSAADPTPTISGLAGGTFSSGAGLSINASTGTIDVSASTPGTYTVTYTTAGTCPNSSNVSVTINAIDNASFSYSAAAYCASAADPTPTISGLAGGTFSSGAGLSINASTGKIDVSASTPGTYTVTYTTAGACPNSSNVSVTINAVDNASFSYSAAAYCVSASDPTPTISGLAGGTFSSGAGLSINASTGTIDVSASTPGTYTVTYTTSGTCPNSSNVSVTINAIDNASFSYSAAAYCVNAADPTPTISGLAGGTFSSGAGLSINASTGKIDVSASTPGTYTVTYTTAGACPNSSNVSVTINAVDNASFSYSAATYCVNESDPTPTISGLAGGTFSSGAGLSINASTGTIDVSASTPGTYTVTYTTSGTCPNSSNVSVTINALDNATFSYSAASYCANGTDPTPTISGLAGGTFSSGAGLSINASTGIIDLSASTAGSYTVTYTTAGVCPNSSTVTVNVNAADDATFSYSSPSYCLSESDPTPTISGLAGGTFSSSPAGLSINASTGTIDVSASTPGTYTVTYTTAGSCPNASSVSVGITTLDDASFSYSDSEYCPNGSDPTPTISGVPGGTFTFSPAGLSIDASTGEIDLSASTDGTYTITYTTIGICANSSDVTVTIQDIEAPVADVATLPDVTAECEVTSLTNPTATDNCGGTVTVTNDATLPITDQGTTVVTWTYEDENGNTSTQTQNIVIDDVTPPVADLASLPDVTAECEVASLTPPTATDNCGGTVTVTNDASLPITDQGTTTITWTYEDENGNTSTQTQNIVIDDVTAPVGDLASLPDVTAECEVASLTPPTATDNCGGTVTISHDAILPITDQGTITVTWTYEDENGNVSTQTQDVVIEDITAPVISDCPGTIALPANTVDCSAIVTWVEPSVTDNCSGVTMVSSHSPGDVFPLGTTTVTYTATDIGLNESTCSFDVVVTSDLSISGVVTDVVFGGDGAIDVTVTGGTPVYTYDWDTDGIGDFDDAEDLSSLDVGTYTITVADANGCTVTEIYNVDLSCSVLTVDVSTETLCENELLTLTATSESGAAITWDGGAINGVPFNPESSGVITYTATSEDADDCPYSVDITVLPTPTVIASSGDAIYCIGESVILSAGGDADSYSWDPLDLTPPLGVTTYTLTGVYEETGCSNTSTVDVMVVDLPTIVANADQTTVCFGNEVTLFGSGGVTYTWSPAGIVNNVAFNPGTVGTHTYSVVGADTFGCANSAEIVITVVAPIAITYTTTDEIVGGDGAIDISFTGGAPAYTFDWNNDGTGDFDDTEDLTGLTAGIYTVVVASEAGCSASKTIILKGQIGIEEETLDNLVVYPNPTIDAITLQLNGQYTYSLATLAGQVLFNGTGNTQKTISLDDLSAGIYLLIVENERGRQVVQVVKN